MYEDLISEVGDPDYLSEFVDFNVNEDGSLGYIVKSEEESIYFISEEKFPGQTSDLLEDEVEDETIMDIIDDLFEV
jgi:hypothetical protein